MDQITAAADVLLDARLTQQQVPGLPKPFSVSEAYQIQTVVTQRLLAHFGGQLIGYKIGCTNEAAQQFLGLDRPFHGRLFSAFTQLSPAQIPPDDFFMIVIEPEFAFEMAVDLPPRSEPYTQPEVTAAVGDMLPAIEIVDSRYLDWTTAGAAQLIADSASHGAFVHGEQTDAWCKVDLTQHRMQLIINGAVSQTGRGEVVLGHPLNALTWLVNTLREQGIGLSRGNLVTTGVCVPQVYNAQSGDNIVADFGSLGRVSLVVA